MIAGQVVLDMSQLSPGQGVDPPLDIGDADLQHIESPVVAVKFTVTLPGLILQRV